MNNSASPNGGILKNESTVISVASFVSIFALYTVSPRSKQTSKQTCKQPSDISAGTLPACYPFWVRVGRWLLSLGQTVVAVSGLLVMTGSSALPCELRDAVRDARCRASSALPCEQRDAVRVARCRARSTMPCEKRDAVTSYGGLIVFHSPGWFWPYIRIHLHSV